MITVENQKQEKFQQKKKNALLCLIKRPGEKTTPGSSINNNYNH